MKALLIYLLVTSICTGAFYGCFRLVMRKETCFAFNRMTLLLIVILPLAIPFLPSPVGDFWVHGVVGTVVSADVPWVGNPVSGIPETVEKTALPTQIQGNPVSAATVLCWVYFVGIVISFALFALEMFRLFVRLKKSSSRKEDGSEVIILPGSVSAASFGKYVVISEDDYANNRQEILIHEQAHQRLGHLFDLILLTAAQIVFWFNPLMYLLKRDMREIHEYQADDYALKQGIDARKYQLLIIRKTVGKHLFALATSFNGTYCQTKKRIAMMNLMKKEGGKPWKSLLYVPIAALSIVMFGNVGHAQSGDRVSGEYTLPAGWNMWQSSPGLYECKIENSVGDGSGAEATLYSVGAAADKFGNLLLAFPAEKYAGKRVRATALAKGKDIADIASFVICFAHPAEGNVTSSGMIGQSIEMSDDWQKREIVWDIPEDIVSLSVGLNVRGLAKLWLKNIVLEIVDDSVPITVTNGQSSE